ncbi:cbb3-type cytochrome c oxidase N-terminal domain-containing protein [Blattabacterium cuenoti]|uniref:cbb3-type cytochrome c oxidase N-terminal domain-containing protein n=1 Tax=Blattabacterium cuenoti TaxID=1653831 RepID=UPI00163C406B|nr:cbb3-type cytochrome c oxidase N-terminal domain-containing protein [Blattabacterium cuenoti]
MRRTKVPFFIIIPIILSIIIFIFYIILGIENRTLIYHPISILFFFVIIILLFVLDFINELIYRKQLKSLTEREKQNILDENEGNYFYRLYKFFIYPTKIENVKKINHGFDDIIELDNKLPIWWVHLFIVTIVISVIYLCADLFTDFSNPYKEYKIAHKQQLKDIEIFEKNMPQITIKNAAFNNNLINSGKALFQENCATCHNNDGSGNIGPNLTDDYWINIIEKDLFKNIFSIVWNGSQNNPTMRAFGKTGELKGNDIQKISSYVYFINTNKNNISSRNSGKSPEGKKIINWNRV